MRCPRFFNGWQNGKVEMMADLITESAVRQWLREHQGSAHCPGCVTKALTLDHDAVRAAMEELAPVNPSRAARACVMQPA
jgi:hypothetical protein